MNQLAAGPGSEPESAGEHRPPHMHIEAQISVAGLVIEIGGKWETPADPIRPIGRKWEQVAGNGEFPVWILRDEDPDQ